MKKLFLLLSFGLLVFVSCKDDDNSTNYPPVTSLVQISPSNFDAFVGDALPTLSATVYPEKLPADKKVITWSTANSKGAGVDSITINSTTGVLSWGGITIADVTKDDAKVIVSATAPANNGNNQYASKSNVGTITITIKTHKTVVTPSKATIYTDSDTPAAIPNPFTATVTTSSTEKGVNWSVSPTGTISFNADGSINLTDPTLGGSNSLDLTVTATPKDAAIASKTATATLTVSKPTVTLALSSGETDIYLDEPVVSLVTTIGSNASPAPTITSYAITDNTYVHINPVTGELSYTAADVTADQALVITATASNAVVRTLDITVKPQISKYAEAAWSESATLKVLAMNLGATAVYDPDATGFTHTLVVGDYATTALYDAAVAALRDTYLAQNLAAATGSYYQWGKNTAVAATGSPAAVGYVSTWSQNDGSAKNWSVAGNSPCPVGWDLPDDADMAAIIAALSATPADVTALAIPPTGVFKGTGKESGSVNSAFLWGGYYAAYPGTLKYYQDGGEKTDGLAAWAMPIRCVQKVP